MIPFFRKDKVDGVTLGLSLIEEYGKESYAKYQDMSDWFRTWFWVQRPWIHAGVIPKKYIFLFELKGESPPKEMPGISAIIAYVDAWNFVDVRTDIESAEAAEKAAVEKAKTQGTIEAFLGTLPSCIEITVAVRAG